MSRAHAHRRVVTGLNEAGRSCVTIDGPVVPLSPSGALAWRTTGVPADNSGAGDFPPAEFSFDLLNGPGSNFLVVETAPGAPAFWHATNSIDYIVVLEGEITLDLEAGSVTLRRGDCLVDRGVVHSWRNDTGGEPAVIACVTLPASPVGKGATV